MWITLLLLTYVALGTTDFPTTSPSDVPSKRPTVQPTTGPPTLSPTHEPTNDPTPEWGVWGDCIPCTNISSGLISLNHLAANVCGCRESNRTCDMEIANYDCESQGYEIMVEECDVDGLDFEISCSPTLRPTFYPSRLPTNVPTLLPTLAPTSLTPTEIPTMDPTTRQPSASPTLSPTANTTGEFVFTFIIIYHGWPPSRNVFESLSPMAALLEVVELDQMDILSSWYISTEPYEMNVTYAFYLPSDIIEAEVAGTVGGAFFTTMLANEILEYWEDETVALSVDDVSFTYVEQEQEPSWGQWELAGLSLGIFLLTLVTIVMLLALVREHFKKAYKRASKLSRSQENLLNSSPRQNWNDETITSIPINVELNGTVDTLHLTAPDIGVPQDTPGSEENSDLVEVSLEEGEHKVERKSVFTDNVNRHARRRTYGHKQSHQLYNIHGPNTNRTARNHLRSRSYADPGGRRQTATEVRDSSRERRKTVLRNMRHSPKKFQVFQYPQGDENGEVNVTVRTRMSVFPGKSPSQSPK